MKFTASLASQNTVIIFSGGRFGPQSLDVATSDAERVLAHWSGYATEENRITTHLLVDGFTFCRLVRGPRFSARSTGSQSPFREDVTCPDCLVALDAFESLGLTPKRSTSTHAAKALKNKSWYTASRAYFDRVRIRWLKPGPRPVSFPWRHASVAALAKHHGLYAEAP